MEKTQLKEVLSVSFLQPDFEKYEERLRTFNEKPWPSDSFLYIKDLVEAGFVYTGEIDLVFCFKCGITESNWQDNENPQDRHVASNQFCPFLTKILTKQQQGSSTEHDSLNTPTIPPINNDAHRSLKSLEDFEREDLLYDWVKGQGVVRRKPCINDVSISTDVHQKDSEISDDQPSLQNIQDKLDELSINPRLVFVFSKSRLWQQVFVWCFVEPLNLMKTQEKYWDL